MKNRMIDVDALDKLLEWLDKNYEYCNDIHGIEKKVVSFKFLLDKINELATLATNPQESIFDAEGWCRKMDLAPEDCKILISNNYDVNTGIRVEKSFFWVLGMEDEKVHCPTAWRPLPTLPKEA